MGEDFAHDTIHNLRDAEDDDGDESEAAASDSDGDTAVAADSKDESAAGFDDDRVPAERVFCNGLATGAADDKTCEEMHPLSGKQADAVHRNKVQILALHGSIEALKHSGKLKVVQIMDKQNFKLTKRERSLASVAPVIPEAFTRQRLANERLFRERQLRAKQAKEPRNDARAAFATKEAAFDKLRNTSHAIWDLESKRACNMTMIAVETRGARGSRAGCPKA